MDIGMAEPVLQHQRRNTGFNATRGECMAQLVLPGMFDPGFITDAFKKAVHLGGLYDASFIVVVENQAFRILLS